jgi:glycosyltransferase involved in cell wall biosynthesis
MNEVLGKVDLLLNIESYASFEAYALGVPVIHLASPCEDIAAFARSEEIGAARVARDPSSLSELILKTLGDPGYHRQQLELQRTFLREFYPQNAPAFHEAVRSAFSTDCGACGT